MTDLKPFPFCAAGARYVQRGVGIKGTAGYDRWHAIQCVKCNAGIGYDDNRFRDKGDAAKAWNTRAA